MNIVYHLEDEFERRIRVSHNLTLDDVEYITVMNDYRDRAGETGDTITLIIPAR